MFLNLPGIVFQPISADVTRQTIKEHFLLRYGIKLLAHTGLTCSDATCEMSRQPTLAKFGFKKRIDHRGLQQDINLLDFVVTVTQNKPFSIWVNLRFCTFIFLPVVQCTVRKIKTFLIYSQPEECS